MFIAKTIQASVFKSIIEVLKEVISDTNITVDETGIKILMMDSSHSCLVSLRLDAETFDEYRCDDQYHLGVNMISFFKLLKSISSNDTITLSMDSVDIHELNIVVENIEKRSKTEYKLKLLDINVETIDIPDVESKTIVTMPSVDLQRISRDIANLSDVVKISAGDNTLQISCEGGFASQCTSLGAAEHGLTFRHNGEVETIESEYSVRFINLFCKASSVSPILEIHIRPNYPLIMKFPISLGTLTFALAPREENNSEDYE